MVQRFVRLEIDPAKTAAFMAIFEAVKEKVRHFEGCRGLWLYNDVGSPSVFYTISLWDSDAALEAYRHSELFLDNWAQMRELFAGKATAYTMELLQKLGSGHHADH